MATMKLEERGIVCDTSKRPPSERVAIFTGLCQARSGSIFCGFQVGKIKHAVTATALLFRSRDGGQTWSDTGARFDSKINGVPGSLANAEVVEAEPGRLLLVSTWFNRSDPNRPLFDTVTQGVLPSKQLLAESTDDGATWSPWREIAIPELKGCSSTGPLLRWLDGTLAYPFESYKEYDDPRPHRHGAWLILSKDGGRTFREVVPVAQDPAGKVYYWDQRLCIGRQPGEAVAMFWTHSLAEKRDLNVHIRSFSLQRNDTKTAPIRATSIPGQITAPVLLEDGRLFAFVVNRGKPGTMTLWCSRDGGTTWPEQLVVHVHDERALATDGKSDVDYVQYWEDMGKWSFGHPAIRSLGNGKLLVAWYAGTPETMSIHWARIAV